MKKIIEAKEFDIITCNREFEKQTGYVFIDPRSFQQLEQLILTFNEDEQADAIDFFNVTTKREVGKIIKVKNYVGMIHLATGLQIEILPKIHRHTTGDTRKIFLKMLKALKDFPTKVFNEAHLNTERMPIFEVFIHLYIQEVQRLVKKGIKSAYYEVENNLNVYKGKMLFNSQIKHNIVHKERFYMRYDEFGINRAENRLIKSTLLQLLKQSTDTENLKEIRKLLMHFELVETSLNYEKDFQLVVINRNSKDYAIIIEWSKVFLNQLSFTTFSGGTSGKALLFPMDKVFEAYVGRHIAKQFSDDWNVSLQDKGFYLFEDKFALRPDIVLRTQDESRIIIIDTKWKLLSNSSSKNYGISQADMYQMYAYAKKYQTNEIFLVYPMNDQFENTKEIQFVSDDGVRVNIFMLDCEKVENSLYNLKLNLG
ncbi:McrC family protein [Bacillus sp. FJAT-22090]|uniref:McrC family protein n=1 Tax=Bacillus sp. FJAT-22090 TaxID=1581038 RepID=UPI0011A04BCC|nr:McrC family protein [Bacillus sp. FJAT-22090]